MISGLVGAGAQEGLEEILVRQLKEQMAQEEIRQAKAREAAESRRLALGERRQAFDEQSRQEDIQQSSMDSLRANNDRMDARLTRLNTETQQEQAEKDRKAALAALLPMLPPHVRQSIEAQEAGVKTGTIGADAFKTQKQIEEEADEAERREIRIRRSSITPPREGPAGKVIKEVGPDGKLRERWATPEELMRGVSVAEGDPNKVTEAEAQRSARVKGAMSFLDRLDGLRAKINTKMGPPQRLGGVVRRGVAMAGLDPDVSQYERERQAAGRALAVAIMGAQNLSDADAASWANLLPDSTVDSETASRLLATVRSTLTKMGGGDAGEPKRLRFDANGNEIKE